MGALCHTGDFIRTCAEKARVRQLKTNAAGNPLKHSFNRPAEAGNWVGEIAGDRSQNSGQQKDSQFNLPFALHKICPLDSRPFVYVYTRFRWRKQGEIGHLLHFLTRFCSVW